MWSSTKIYFYEGILSRTRVSDANNAAPSKQFRFSWIAEVLRSQQGLLGDEAGGLFAPRVRKVNFYIYLCPDHQNEDSSRYLDLPIY